METHCFQGEKVDWEKCCGKNCSVKKYREKNVSGKNLWEKWVAKVLPGIGYH